MDITAAELIIRFLEQRSGPSGPAGEYVAGIPGGALLPLYRALADSRLQHILARHEQGAGFIAQGLARVTGRAGVCLATSGPGITNTVTALADAKADSVPMVCFSGQVPRALIGTDAFQEVRTCQIVESITKACFDVRDAAALPELLPEAFRIAESGRPGPVLIDLPKDVQLQRLRLGAIPAPREAERAAAPDAEAIARAARMIDAAQRPVLYIGGGITQARAQPLARALAEKGELPVAMTLMALGTLDDGHPLSLGMLGMHGGRHTNMALDACDLLIAIGCRFDDRATGKLELFAPKARVIHIDADRRELNKLRRADLAIQADAGLALQALLDALPARRRGRWLGRIASLRAAYAPAAAPRDDDLRDPQTLMRAIAALTPADAAITTDVGQHQMWVAQHYPLTRPDRWLTSGGLGTMGFGLPAAIGAALALPESGAVCISGDGSFLMNVQELATLAELHANVKIVVLDNRALGMVRQQQNLFYERRYSGSLYAQAPSLAAIAAAFGVPAIDLEQVRDPQQALRDAFAQPGPMLVRAPVAVEEMVLPMVKPGAANTEAIG